MPGDIIILHTCTKTYDQMIYSSWDKVCDRRTDRQTDLWIWRKKWHIEVGAPRKNKEKHLEISLFCTCVPKIFMGMIHSSWDIEHDRFKFWVIFYPFTPLKTQKLRILKNNKTCWRYNHFTHVYQKQQSYEVRFLKYGVRGTEFFIILCHFLPFYPTNNPENQNFEKMKKATGDYFTYLYQKSWSYDVCFLRYGEQQT